MFGFDWGGIAVRARDLTQHHPRCLIGTRKRDLIDLEASQVAGLLDLLASSTPSMAGRRVWSLQGSDVFSYKSAIEIRTFTWLAVLDRVLPNNLLQLANIIWGEDCKGDDHIVPFKEETEGKRHIPFGDYDKKECKQEPATIKTESQEPGATIGVYSDFGTSGLSTSEYGAGSWPDGTFKNDKHSRDFDQVENKDESDFLDYGWANVGSFDDLDKLISLDDPIFGHVSLGNADELWQSSKDVTDSPMKYFPFSGGSPTLGPGCLKNASENSEIEAESARQEGFCNDKFNEATSQRQLDRHEIRSSSKGRRGKSKPMVEEQMAWDMVGGDTSALDFFRENENIGAISDSVNKVPKKPPKCRKTAERNEEKIPQAYHGACSPSGSQVIQTCWRSVLNQERQLEDAKSLQYQQHLSNPFLGAGSENVNIQASNIPALSCVLFGDTEQPALLSSYEVSPGHLNPLKESQDSSAKSLTMTPQEKIDKLRRRQQMQAMLAIKKQQEQLNPKKSSIGHSITQNCLQDDQVQRVCATIIPGENTQSHTFLDPYTPAEQDDSSTSLALDDYSAEETIFHKLQDIISKLDIRIRLRLRDSLFRLAQSASQRHYVSGTSSTNRINGDEHTKSVIREEINTHSRYPRMTDMETETNPLDRAVAHLLFHRPLKSSGKHPEPPVSSNLAPDHNMQNFGNMACLPESFHCKQNLRPQRSNHLYSPAKQQVDLFNNMPGMECSENISNIELADGGAMET